MRAFQRQLAVVLGMAVLPAQTLAQPDTTVGAVEGTFRTCMGGAAATARGSDLLVALDWIVTDRTDLPESSVDALAARNLLNHVNAVPASDRWEATWDMVRENAANEARQSNDDGVAPATRFFTRQGDESLLVVSRNMIDGATLTACEIIATPDLDAAFDEFVGDTERYPNPIQGFERQDVGSGYVQVFGYDRSRIEPAIGQDFPFFAYMQMVPE